MDVLSLLEQVQVCLPAEHQVMTPVQGAYSRCKELICITYKNVSQLSSYHCGDRYPGTVCGTQIHQCRIILVSASYGYVHSVKIQVALHKEAWLYR